MVIGVAAGDARVGTVVNGGKNRVVQMRTVRKDGWTAVRRAAFLLAVSMTANVTTAAASAGMTRSGANALRRREPAFAALWAQAMKDGYDRLEEALLAATLAGLDGDPAGAMIFGQSGQSGESVESGAAGIDGVEAPIGEADPNSGSGAGAVMLTGAMPGCGIVPLTSLQAVQVGLAMLARFRAAESGGGGKIRRHPRATVAETNASIAKKLDSLAQRLRASVGEGEA